MTPLIPIHYNNTQIDFNNTKTFRFSGQAAAKQKWPMFKGEISSPLAMYLDFILHNMTARPCDLSLISEFAHFAVKMVEYVRGKRKIIRSNYVCLLVPRVSI